MRRAAMLDCAEYMASGSLRAAMNRQENSLNQGWVRVVLALDAAKGMEYLHSKSIVHFDLKVWPH